MHTSSLMHSEAREAPEAVKRLLERNQANVSRWTERLRSKPPTAVVTGARGSSDHAATYAKFVFETATATLTMSASPSVNSVYATVLRMQGAVFLAISQSGRSPDLLAQAEAARRGGAEIVALVNDENSPLARQADLLLPLHAGPERSVAATKSYLCALAGVLQICAHWSQQTELLQAVERLPDQLAEAFELDWSTLVSTLTEANNLFVLGRGPGLAIAQEAALKLKETCGIHGEAYSAAEVKHGPMTLVVPSFPVLVFAQNDASRQGTLALAHEFAERGARVLCADPEGPCPLPVHASAHPYCAPLLQIQSFYRAANALSIARGRDPDRPPHLQKITETV